MILQVLPNLPGLISFHRAAPTVLPSMKLKPAILALATVSLGVAKGQTSYTSTSETSAWNAARWNNTSDASPYTSTFSENNAVSFTSGTYTFAGMGSSTNVGNVTVASGVNVTFTSNVSTYATNGAIRTFSLGSGSLFDFDGQQISTAANTGFIIGGSGVFATGVYSSTANVQSFRLDGGTVIARGTTGLGNGSNSSLTLNGGTIASNGNRAFDNTRFGGGITIGGNVQFGELSTVVSLASSSANLSFANNVSLGAATRTLTIGNNGTNTFSGVISGDAGTGLTVSLASGASGNITLGGVNNYSGPTTIKGGKLILNSTGTIADSTSIVVGDGGSSGASLDTTTKVGFTISDTQTLSGIGAVNVGAGKTLTIEGTHSVGNVGTSGGVGNQVVTGNLNYTGSIFNWDLNPSVSGPDPGIVANNGAYDKMTATGTITGTLSAFNVVLGAGKSFTDAFWNTDKSWADVFTGSSAPGLASIFTTFGGSGVDVDGIVTGRGQFGFTGSALTWTAVPEPSSALAGLLITAGLLRRRRVA
jgi:hypothetical protein